MPLQCDTCEGIGIVPMLMDTSTLRRHKCREPRFMVAIRVQILKDFPARKLNYLVPQKTSKLMARFVSEFRL